jgi:cyclopropane fatty-acyl-phospholipid synthase-like methyltransferase
MTTPENPADLFQQGWKNYRLILEYDYLWHGMAADALERLIADRIDRPGVLRFLDLACGDSATTSMVLNRIAERRPTSSRIVYLGVDNSRIALAEAGRTRFVAGIEPTFVESDFVEFLKSGDSRFDVIYVGMSAHHLGLGRLPEFFAAVRERLSPGGLFVAFETFCLPDETRDEHMARLHAIVRNFWIRMPQSARDHVIAHTTECDFPVTVADWNEGASQAGLGPGKIVMKSPDRLSAMIVHPA